MDQLKRHIDELRYQMEWMVNTGQTARLWPDGIVARAERVLFELNQPTIKWASLIDDLRWLIDKAPFRAQAPHAWYFAVGLSTCLDPTAPQYWKPEAKLSYFQLTNEMAELVVARRAEAESAQECWLRHTALNQAAIVVYGAQAVPDTKH